MSEEETFTKQKKEKVSTPEAPKQTELSQSDLRSAKDIYLKPHKTINSREKFNERFREDYNFMKEYVQFVAEHLEIKGEDIDVWTKPFAGIPAEEWIVPVNKPVWGPRYLAEQIRKKSYNRLKIDQTVQSSEHAFGSMYGAIVADTKVKRLDAYPVSSKRSVFF